MKYLCIKQFDQRVPVGGVVTIKKSTQIAPNTYTQGYYVDKELNYYPITSFQIDECFKLL